MKKIKEMLQKCKALLVQVSENNTYHGTTNAIISRINTAILSDNENILVNTLTETKLQIKYLSEKYEFNSDIISDIELLETTI